MLFSPATIVKWIFYVVHNRSLNRNTSVKFVRESNLTNSLIKTLKGGGIKKLIELDSYKDVSFHREVGTSSYVADICISTANLSEFNNKKASFVAIEVKISDWENGLYQAWRYNSFAEKSFLAIYKPFAERVNINEFTNNNIGLIVFDENNIQVLHNPKSNKFKNETYEANVRKKIWGNLFNVQSISPAY